MLRQLALLAGSAALVLANAAPASAATGWLWYLKHGGGAVTPPPATCVYTGVGSADGCSGANQNANFLAATAYGESFYAYVTQNGQTWTGSHPWNWNAPGVDYPVGYDTTLNLKDPASGGFQTGCSYQVHTGSSYWVRCSSGANNVDIEGYDFSRGGAHCVSIYLDTGVTGTVTIKNNKFGYGAGECDLANNSLIRADAGSSVSITNNDINEGAINTSNAIIDVILNSGVTGPVTVEYNRFNQSGNRAMQANPSGGSVTFNYNYVYGMNCGNNTGNHGEVTISPTASGSVSLNDYNTIVFDSVCSNNNTTTFYVASVVAFTNYEILGNVIVTNDTGWVVGGPGNGATFNGTISGTTLTINSGLSGTVLPNQLVTGTGVTSLSEVLNGSGSTWTLSQSSTAGPESMTAAPNPSVSYVMSEFQQTSTFTTFTLQNNYYDLSGAQGCNYNSAPTATTTNFSGNLSLNTGTTLNAWQSAKGSAHCQ